MNQKEPASERADDPDRISTKDPPIATRTLAVVLRALGRLPGPPDECMVDNPRHKAGSSAVTAKKGMTGAKQAGIADDWDKVIGVASPSAK